MKKLIGISIFLAATASHAGTCKIKARAYESYFSCPVVSLDKFHNVTEAECGELVQEALSTNLFRILDLKRGEKIMHLDHTFQEGRYKVKDRIVLEEWREHCMGGIL